MAVIPGTRLGPYEILTLLGSGGMGEVYRAHDTKLNRDVALKVLPESVARAPDHLARFQREAQVLAALNHPNIAHIHGLEESDGSTGAAQAPSTGSGQGVLALVMELVEGPTLADRLGRAGGDGREERAGLAIEDALAIARVYVTTFPDPSRGRWPISSGGGYQPRWRRDGKELLYFTGDGKLMSVDVTLSPSFKARVPKVLFQAPIYGGGGTLNQHRWDLTADGQRFLINTVAGEASAPITVVLNWQQALKK